MGREKHPGRGPEETLLRFSFPLRILALTFLVLALNILMVESSKCTGSLKSGNPSKAERKKIDDACHGHGFCSTYWWKQRWHFCCWYSCDYGCKLCKCDQNYRGTWCQITCSECSPGWRKSTTCSGGSDTGCTKCGVGQYKPDYTYRTYCYSCSYPSYQDETGQSGCKSSCPKGTYTTTSDRTRYYSCPAGYQCPYTNCYSYACDPQTYQDAGGQSSCKACPMGQYQPYTGRTSCYTCNGISDCNSVQCTSSSDQTCVTCATNAYRTTNQKQCIRTCSWPGLYCFPGDCTTNDAGRQCTCKQNFEGTNCQQLKSTADPVIEAHEAQTCVGGSCLTNLYDGKPLYTNIKGSSIKVDWSHYFKPLATGETLPSLSYISTWSVGIIGASVSLYRGFTLVGLSPSYTWGVGAAPSQDAPHMFNNIQMNTATFSQGAFTGNDGETVTLRISTTNGGYVQVTNMSPARQYIQNAQITTQDLALVFDYTPPYNTNNAKQFNPGEETTTSNSVTVSWEGWADATSPISTFAVKACPMIAGSTLKDDESKCVGAASFTTQPNSTTFTLSNIGMWAFRLDVLDAATNVQQVRRLMIYDNAPTVQINGVMRVVSAVNNGVQGSARDLWQIQNTKLAAVWVDAFFSSNEKWLGPVEDIHGLLPLYDHPTTGKITRSQIPNTHGIVDFQYSLSSPTNGIGTVGWTSLKDAQGVPEQSLNRSVLLGDGHTYVFAVRGYDIMGVLNTLSVTFKVDVTPPELSDLSLSRDGIEGLFVHNMSDLMKMNVVFKASDAESGLQLIRWVIYGYSNGDVMDSDPIMAPQTVPVLPLGNSYSLVLSKYPILTEAGKHNKAYTIIVTVINQATLVSTVAMKILADATPPTTGTVQDNEPGALVERDFQLGMEVHASMIGFEDPESQIRYYKYAITGQCLTMDDLALFSTSIEPYVSVVVPKPGKYYATVVAYNNALQPSQLVCSDGVTVDASPPALASMEIDNVKVNPGYAVDSKDGSYWMVHADMTRTQLVHGSASICPGAPSTDMVLFKPATGFLNATLVCPKASPFRMQLYQSVMEVVNCSWVSAHPLAEIADFEVGLSSSGVTDSMPNPAANIMMYTSTTHATSFTESHSDLTLGKEFYLLLKVLKRSSLSKVFSFGPILVDYTAPLTGVVEAEVGAQYVSVLWQDTVDPQEQGNPLTYFVGVNGQNGGRVDNVAAFRLATDEFDYCNSTYTEGSGCATVPTSATKGANSYRVVLKACNSAGLCSLSFSSPLYALALAPPAHGIIEELAVLSSDEPDADFQSSLTSVIARWRGFSRVHSSVDYEVGLGTKPLADDVVPLFSVPSSTSMYEIGANLTEGVKYYITIRATNAFGTVTASSDGVIPVLPGEFALAVQDGRGCGAAATVLASTDTVQVPLNASFEHSSNATMNLGSMYTFVANFTTLAAHMVSEGVEDGGLLLVEINPADSTSQTLQAQLTTATSSVLLLPFTAMDASLAFRLTLFPSTALQALYGANESIDLDSFSVKDCAPDLDFESASTRLACNWGLPAAKQASAKPFTFYEWSIEMDTEDMRTELLFPFRAVGVAQSASFDIESDGVEDLGADQYRCVVRACHPLGCYDASKSDGFTLIHTMAAEQVSASYTLLPGNQSSILVDWNAFTINDQNLAEGIVLYTWAVGSNAAGHALLTGWHSVAPGLGSTFQVQGLLEFSVVHHDFTAPLMVLVAGHMQAGTVFLASAPLVPGERIDSALLVPVLDVTTLPSAVVPVSQMVDVQYSSSATRIGAVWPLFWTSAKPDYYLWSISENRKFSDCSDLTDGSPALGCGKSKDRFMLADKLQLQNGHRYYVCIRVGETTLVNSLDAQKVWSNRTSCSNGITVDLTPPSAGKVRIGHSSVSRLTKAGFQASSSHITVEWEGFTDVDGMEEIVHPDGILHYEVCVGSVWGGCDIVPLTDAGSFHHRTFKDLRLTSGATFYATVRAYDFVGQYTAVTSDGVTVDATPPLVGEIKVTQSPGTSASEALLEIVWQDFSDPESDIVEYLVGVGSTESDDNVVALVVVGIEPMASLVVPSSLLLEGHTAFVIVEAINGAGLISHAAVALDVHVKPPVASQIVDGESGPDVDSIASQDTVYARWEPFYSPTHSIASYEWALGTAPGATDVAPFERIGDLSTALKVENLELIQGHTYYVSVRGCDSHGLCTTASSNGFVVDMTAPLPGVVFDGMEPYDIDFQFSSTYIGATWNGFYDPESGVDHYQWCVGTSRLSCDVRGFESVGLSSEVTDPNFSFPPNETLYITVKAVNHAGSFVSVSSNGITLDTEAPTIVSPVAWSPVVHIADSPAGYVHQVDPTVLRGTWKFHDQHYGSLRFFFNIDVHHDSGGIMTERLLASEDGFALTGLKLEDGDVYYLSATACDAANLCTTSKDLAGMLVDSSAPYEGSFVNDLKWTQNTMVLKFTNFSDPHSGLFLYSASIGTEYGAADIAGPQRMAAPKSVDEIVTFSLSTRTSVVPATQVYYITLEAMNGVGLMSKPVQIAVKAVAGGFLEIQRHSCDVTSCTHACTCGPNGLCPNQVSGPCVNGTSTPLAVVVQDGLGSADLDYQSSVATLAAMWTDLGSYRAQYSVGLKGSPPGSMLFPGGADVWLDANSRNLAVFKCSADAMLMHDAEYVFYLRVWYNSSFYVDYHSNGVLVDKTFPQVSRSSRIQERFPVLHSEEVDSLPQTSELNVTWNVPSSVFMDQEGLAYYQYSLGTAPGSSDVIGWTSVGLSEEVTLANLRLAPFRVYYTSVRAWNKASLMTMRTSDGFFVDSSPPLAGFVTDGYGSSDIDVQTSLDALSATWFGFHDLESTVVRYELSIGTTPGAGDVYPLVDVGLINNITITGLALEVETQYFVNVVAYNSVGLASSMVSSDGVWVDVSAPMPEYCSVSSAANLVQDASFEGASSHWELAGTVFVASRDHSQGTQALQFGNSSAVIKTLPVASTARQSIATSPGKRHILSFYATVNSDHIEASQLLEVRAPGVVETFSVRRELVHDSAVWLHYMLHFTAETNVSVIEFSSTPHRYAAVLDSVSVQECGLGDASNTSVVYAGPAFQTAVADVRAMWSIVDDKSGISEFLWAIGTTPFSQQLQPYVSVGKQTSASNPRVALPHNSSYYVSVVARNGVGLTRRFHSSEVFVDHTAPIFEFITDGTSEDDQDFADLAEISASWRVVDEESGVESCVWGAGTQPGDANILPFSAVTGPLARSNGKVAAITHEMVVYVTVRCRNRAGLLAEASTNGVRYLLQPLESPSAFVTFVKIGDEGLLYRSLPGFQSSRSMLQVSWDGFERDETDIASYEVLLQGPASSGGSWVNVGAIRSTVLANLTLVHNTTYKLSVRGVDHVNKRTEPVSSSMTIDSTPPTRKSTGKLCTAFTAAGLNLNWTTLFGEDVCSPQAPSCLAYELSVGTASGSVNTQPLTSTTSNGYTVPFAALKKVYLQPDTVDKTVTYYITLTAVNNAGLSLTLSFDTKRMVAC